MCDKDKDNFEARYRNMLGPIQNVASMIKEYQNSNNERSRNYLLMQILSSDNTLQETIDYIIEFSKGVDILFEGAQELLKLQSKCTQ